jgi:hypothetical protein
VLKEFMQVRHYRSLGAALLRQIYRLLLDEIMDR